MTKVPAFDERAPKHVVIREYVRNLVSGGAPGSPAPSERELVEKFSVARMTVRQAMDALVSEGVLERFPGRGTFVARPRPLRTGVFGFTDEMARRGVSVVSRTVVVDRIPAPPSVARALEIPVERPVVRWRRVRFVDGSPTCVTDVFLPDEQVPGFLESDPPASLYDHLATRGIRPTRAEDAVAAATAEPADAALLEVAVGTVVLQHSRRALAGITPVEVSRTVYRADRHTLRLHLHD
ncbi:GntR family transcriptional regulator [Nocardioides sp. YIM 152588]|uniref:GntR family transcriptional regulator n=1 Tax=Nocardioides sp. YIM 152588 TaxID=3158259 RepID=UPI0032E3C854